MSWIVKSSQNKVAFFIELLNVTKLLLRKRSLCNGVPAFAKIAVLSDASTDCDDEL